MSTRWSLDSPELEALWPCYASARRTAARASMAFLEAQLAEEIVRRKHNPLPFDLTARYAPAAVAGTDLRGGLLVIHAVRCDQAMLP
jgi:hypothetical protein